MRVTHKDFPKMRGTLIRMLTTCEDSVSVGLIRWDVDDSDRGREEKEDMDNIVELGDDS